jgi:phage shock protein A
MEPFIIEEFLGFIVLAACAGFGAYYLLKIGLNAREAFRAAAQAPESPKRKIARIIRESEVRLSSLRDAMDRLQRHHAQLRASSERSTQEYEQCQAREAKCEAGGGSIDELRTLIKQRLEAEQIKTGARAAEDAARNASDELERKFNELERKIVLARAAEAAVNARILAAEIKHEIHDDFGGGTDAALEDLENEAVKSEARAEAQEETSLFFKACSARVTEDDITAELEKKQVLRRKE